MFPLHGVVFHSVIEQTTFNGNSISFVPAWNHVCFHLVRSTMYINFKFFTQRLIGCTRLNETDAYLTFRKLRSMITFCMQFYGANKLISS